MEENAFVGVERRESTRKRARLNVDFVLKTDPKVIGSVKVTETWTDDIGEEGLCLAARVSYPIGSRVALRVYLPGGREPLELIGQVVWVRKYHKEETFRVGIRYEEIEPKIKQEIMAFVTSKSEKSEGREKKISPKKKEDSAS